MSVLAAVPRAVHPAAWWFWALGIAVGAALTTNPLLLGLAVAVLAFVVAQRRSNHPWARAFRLYLLLGLLVVAIRGVLHVLVGLKTGTILVLPLPRLTLPAWAAGIELGGPVHLEGLLGAALQGLRLAVMLAAVGAANTLANPKRLLRALPGALAEIGAAVVVTVSVAPQLAESVLRVRRARALRGDTRRGLRGIQAVALPVLEDTLDRSLLLASAMDSRGYGRRAEVTGAAARLVAPLTLAGLVLLTLGSYGVLDATTPRWLGTPSLLLGTAAGFAGLALGGRAHPRTTYRPDPWAAPEWLTVLAGAAAVAGLLLTQATNPLALAMPLAPLGIPALPPYAVAGLLLAALPAMLTPEPPVAHRQAATRRGGTRD